MKRSWIPEMTRVASALAGLALAAPAGADRDRDLSVIPPCSAPSVAETTGWQRVKWTVNGRRLLVDLPSSFYLDRRVRFHHGGQLWTDGFRVVRFVGGGQYTCVPGSVEYPGCQECGQILGNVTFRLVSTYENQNGVYVIAAVHDVDPSDTVRISGAGKELRATSALAEDQSLLLRIVHSTREDSRIADRGTLFLGGNQLDPPYVMTNVDARLVVNGYALPDILPPVAPAADAELETRRSVRRRLETLRDSLVTARAEWTQANEILATHARALPFVDSVRVFGRPGVHVTWEWGFQHLYLHRTGSYSMGSPSKDNPDPWQQTEDFIFRRADRLRELLQDGNVVFLLGGGAEITTSGPDPKAFLQDVERLRRDPNARAPAWMPQPLQTQLIHPIALEDTTPDSEAH